MHRGVQPLWSRVAAQSLPEWRMQTMASYRVSRRQVLKGAAALGALGGIMPLQGGISTSAEPSARHTGQLSSPPIKALAGYFTPDGYRHAIVGTSDGKLNEVFFSPQTGKGIARLACFDAILSVDGFIASDDGYQIEIVATS